MNRIFIGILLVLIFLIGCNRNENVDISQLAEDVPFIQGNQEYINSPFIAAGDRVYMVGHQDGSFPEIGWHIKGEMGGIWNHPIKLMDGFDVELEIKNSIIPLKKSDSFVNFPFTNKHVYILKDHNLVVERWQFVPDHKEGIVIQFILKNTGHIAKNLKFHFKGSSDLRPTWLGEQTNMIDGDDTAVYKKNEDIWLVKDSLNPWYVIYGANQNSIENQVEQNNYSGKGVSNALTYKIELQPSETKTINFTIAGSFISEENAWKSYESIQNNFQKDFETKQHRYQKLANQTKLTIPDKKLQQTFEWLKYNCDWLVRTVPGIGTGITAGIPDYPWWFGVDSEYALKGYMAVGQTDAVYKTIHLLDSVSNALNGNGRIIHEMSTNGAVFNKGNINETPQFASLIWEIYQWNGDRKFLKKYFPTIKNGLEWLLSENDTNKNLFPDGFGMMEIHGLNSEMIDVAAYTQRAFADASKIAMDVGEEDLANSYQEIAAKLKDKINTEFWSEEFASFADFIGTDEQALKLIDDAIIRADTLNKPWAVAELQQTKESILKNPSKKSKPFVLHHNWVVNTPMEMKIASPDKAIKALKTAEKFVNPFGVFVTGIDRDASAGSDEGSFKGSKAFSYTGAVMTLPTGVLVVSENNYGRPDKALEYLKKMTKSFSYALPGSMYEVSPDYGMITQAWNIYSFAIPIVQQFFGIQPQAAQKKVRIQIQMPQEWNEASLENVAVADNEISIFYKKIDEIIELSVTQENTEWELELVFPKSEKTSYKLLQGELEVKENSDQIVYTSKDSKVMVQMSN